MDEGKDKSTARNDNCPISPKRGVKVDKDKWGLFFGFNLQKQARKSGFRRFVQL